MASMLGAAQIMSDVQRLNHVTNEMQQRRQEWRHHGAVEDVDGEVRRRRAEIHQQNVGAPLDQAGAPPLQAATGMQQSAVPGVQAPMTIEKMLMTLIMQQGQTNKVVGMLLADKANGADQDPRRIDDRRNNSGITCSRCLRASLQIMEVAMTAMSSSTEGVMTAEVLTTEDGMIVTAEIIAVAAPMTIVTAEIIAAAAPIVDLGGMTGTIPMVQPRLPCIY
jgi:hypothetical protein